MTELLKRNINPLIAANRNDIIIGTILCVTYERTPNSSPTPTGKKEGICKVDRGSFLGSQPWRIITSSMANVPGPLAQGTLYAPV